MNQILFSILLIIVGLVIGFGLTVLISFIKENNATKRINAMLENAKKETERLRRDSLMEIKEKTHQLKIEADKDIRERKQELKETETRLLQRENNMDKRDELYQKRESNLDERENKLTQKQQEIQNQFLKQRLYNKWHLVD